MAWWKLPLTRHRAEAAIAEIARRHCPTAKVFRWRGSPSARATFCVEVATDSQRHQIISDGNLDQQFRQALYAAGYTADVVPTIRFRVESRETLDRKFGGNWWEAMEMP